MSRFLEANRTRMRKLSLWTAMIGLGCFVSGAVVPALIVRVVTELLRLPTLPSPSPPRPSALRLPLRPRAERSFPAQSGIQWLLSAAT